MEKSKMFSLMALNRLTRTMVKDELYLDSLTFIHMVLMALTPMMQKKKAAKLDETHSRGGVTGICPTTITQIEEVLTKAVKNVAKVVADGYEGAEILGIHFEGPYLDMVYKGAQPEQCIVKPDVEQFKRYQKAADGLIKIITMATERDEDFELTRYCAANDVRVSIGHSAATIEEAGMAIATEQLP